MAPPLPLRLPLDQRSIHRYLLGSRLPAIRIGIFWIVITAVQVAGFHRIIGSTTIALALLFLAVSSAASLVFAAMIDVALPSPSRPSPLPAKAGTSRPRATVWTWHGSRPPSPRRNTRTAIQRMQPARARGAASLSGVAVPCGLSFARLVLISWW